MLFSEQRVPASIIHAHNVLLYIESSGCHGDSNLELFFTISVVTNKERLEKRNSQELT